MIGTRFAAYEITAKLGEGGMGEVYRAHDTKLKRDVAIKVLPPEFTADKERLARFEREAQLLAQLHHPNIASIFAMEKWGQAPISSAAADGGAQGVSVPTFALVMELVEGPTLAERLEHGPLPCNESLSISLQIAQALEEAHEKGIIHRDLKPQNIKASMEGKVKVLDFGLAKAMDPAAGSAASAADMARSPTLMQSPTLTAVHGTQLGVILGTAAYMAPEQAKGLPIDKRADIWAFGVVLFEMLSGRSLFAGDTVTDTLAGVLKTEIDFSKLPAETPAAIRRLLRRCLERDPKNRLHDIADARIELTDIDARDGRPGRVHGAGARRSALAPLPWVLALLGLGFAGWSWLAGREATQAPQPIVASLPPPAGASFLAGSAPAISPDGSSVAFAARDESGVERIWLRSLRDGSARALAGTERGRNPFWSPDSRALGFFDDEHLKRITLGDGVVETYRDTAAGRPGGAWSPQGVIVVAADRGLFRLPVAGGDARPLSPDGADSTETAASDPVAESLSPAFLPDGKHFLYLARNYADSEAKRELRVGSLDGRPHKTVLRVNSNAVYAPSGELVWWQDGHLRAQPFDLERLELTGAPRLVRSGVAFDPRNGLAMFSIAADGTLVVRQGGVVSGDELALVDRRGADLGTLGPPGNFYVPRLSPDGTLVAVDQSDETNRGDIWIYDVARRTGTRWTSHPEDESDPVWSPDGRQLAFSSLREAAQGAIHVGSLHRSGDEKLLHASPDGSLAPLSWSVDGVIVAEQQTFGRLGRAFTLGAYSLTGGTFSPIAAGRFSVKNGSLSPDGRFLAYDTDETGQPEVYVQPFPDASDRWRVSNRGGAGPFWRSDARELFFLNGDSELSAVAVRPSPGSRSLSFGEPEVLFRLRPKDHRDRQVDTVDGRTFVVNRTATGGETEPLTLLIGVGGLAKGPR
ncbi:MAG TPA: protein kinase [Thermoanaerobaculia bacterium]